MQDSNVMTVRSGAKIERHERWGKLIFWNASNAALERKAAALARASSRSICLRSCIQLSVVRNSFVFAEIDHGHNAN